MPVHLCPAVTCPPPAGSAEPAPKHSIAPVALLSLFALLIAAGTAVADPAEDQIGPQETPQPPAIDRGIDVSGHTREVDWAQVAAAGYTFAVTKATEGLDLLDPMFAENWQGMADAGLVRGAYHFYVTEDDPSLQANFFIRTVTLGPGDLVPVVDVELIGHDTPKAWVDDLRTFLRFLEDHYGVKPILYTSPTFWNTHVGEGFGDYPLWVAEYGVDAPTLPVGWDRWSLWQYAQAAEVPGVPDGADEGADLSRVAPDADLHRLFMPPVSVTP